MAETWKKLAFFDEVLSNVVEDLTPQLGGDLDLQTYKIVGEGGSSGIYVDSSGRVGIGISSLSSAFQVKGWGARFEEPTGSSDFNLSIFGGGSSCLILSGKTDKAQVSSASSLPLYLTNTVGNGIVVTNAGNVLFTGSGYLNFGATSGSTGYGFYDNGGTIQYKNSGGSWADIIDSIVRDTTPQLGGNLDLNQKSIVFDPSPTDDHTWNGEVFTGTAGENLAIFETCYLKSDGKYWKTDASAEATAKGKIVMATAAINADATGAFLQRGYIRDDSTDEWDGTLAAADEMYLSETAGNLTDTAPTTSSAIVRIVGWMESATVLYFNPDATYVEVD